MNLILTFKNIEVIDSQEFILAILISISEELFSNLLDPLMLSLSFICRDVVTFGSSMTWNENMISRVHHVDVIWYMSNYQSKFVALNWIIKDKILEWTLSNHVYQILLMFSCSKLFLSPGQHVYISLLCLICFWSYFERNSYVNSLIFYKLFQINYFWNHFKFDIDQNLFVHLKNYVCHSKSDRHSYQTIMKYVWNIYDFHKIIIMNTKFVHNSNSTFNHVGV